MKNFKIFAEIAKHHKRLWVETTKRGDMPPTVIGIKNGKPQVMVVAPEIDKWQGLRAANVIKQGLGSDQIVFITDAHTILIKDKSKEEAKRIAEKYIGKPGSMQKACDEEDACAAREIADCIVVQVMESPYVCHMATYTYDYHGKDGGIEFKWMEDHFQETMNCEVDSGLVKNRVNNDGTIKEQPKETGTENENKPPKIGGLLVSELAKILLAESIFDSEQFKEAIRNDGLEDLLSEENREKAAFHFGMAARKTLIQENFMVLEIINASNNYEEFVKEMIEKYKVYENLKKSEKGK